MNFDRQKFFEGYRDQWGKLNPRQVRGLNFILDAVAIDPHITDVRWLAYMLATTKHETADTFQPIHEYGSHAYFVKRYGGQTVLGRRLGNDTPEEGVIYAGQGDVQLTGESNYEKAEAALRREYPELIAAFEARTGRTFDLTVGDQPDDIDDPKNAQDPAIAYAIMSYGMRSGMFTGKKLSDYINAVRCDYVEARRIINGTDRAMTIADYAIDFARILKNSAADTLAKPTSDNAPTAAADAVDDPAVLNRKSETVNPVNEGQPPDTSSIKTIEEKQIPGGTKTVETKEESFNPSTITQIIPRIVGSKRWFGSLSIGGIVSTSWAAFNGMPPWVVFALGMLTAVVIIGFAFILIRYKSQLFDLVNAVIKINADPASNNIQLMTKPEADTVPVITKESDITKPAASQDPAPE